MKRIISLLLLVVIMALTLISCSNAGAEQMLRDISGVRNVRVSKNIFGNVTVKIGQFFASGYSVQEKDDDIFYIGERPASLDDYMLPQRVKITLWDVDAHKRFEKRYEKLKVYNYDFRSYQVQFMWNYNSDHGVDIYIASDATLSVEEQASSDIPLFRALRIKVVVEK